jgi:hypothetical protein
MPVGEEGDPKYNAREARDFPETEKTLRQFLRLESGNYARDTYRNSEVWCECGRGMNRRAKDGSTAQCRRCAPDAEVEP